MLDEYPSPNTPESHFWTWFEANAQTYRDFEPGSDNLDAIFDALQVELDKVAQGFVFEFGNRLDGDREFILSANCIPEVFPAVEALVAAAPALPSWKFTAFRQRGAPDATLQINDLSLGPDQIFFKLARDGEKIGIFLYIADYHRFTDHQLAIGTFLLLDNAIGEHDVVRKVGFIERQPLPDHPRGQGLRPLDELSSLFDAFYAEMHPY